MSHRWTASGQIRFRLACRGTRLPTSLRPRGSLGIAASTGSTLSSPELMKIAVYVEDNLGEPIKLADLATIAGVSVSHFARLFKLSTGVTAMSFVEQCRVRRAQTLIHDRDLPLVEVALITGFSDQAISRDAIVYTPAARLPLLRVSMGAGVPHSGSTTRPRWLTRWRHQSIL